MAEPRPYNRYEIRSIVARRPSTDKLKRFRADRRVEWWEIHRMFGERNAAGGIDEYSEFVSWYASRSDAEVAAAEFNRPKIADDE